MKDSLQKALHQVILVRFLQTFTRSQNKNSTVLLICYVLVGATVTLIVTGAERDVQASAQQREHTTGLTFTTLLSPLRVCDLLLFFLLVFHFSYMCLHLLLSSGYSRTVSGEGREKATYSLTNGSRLRWSLSVRVRADGDLMIQQQELSL